MEASLIDPMLQNDGMLVSGLGIEREGLRGQNLAITVAMENAEESWGGVYMANIAGDTLNSVPLKNTKKTLLQKR